jgi:predicted DNA-binding transcriptional regulator AlpA
VDTITDKHIEALVRQRTIQIRNDPYGKPMLDKWNSEVEYFITHHVRPSLSQRSAAANRQGTGSYIATDFAAGRRCCQKEASSHGTASKHNSCGIRGVLWRDSLVRLFGEQRSALTGLQEEELIEKLAGRVAAQLGTSLKPQPQAQKRYIREKEAAAFLGVSVKTLRSWRNKGSPTGPPVTRIDRMVLYSMEGLEQFMEQRTVGRR